MLEAIIRKAGGGSRRVWLRELTGHDELDVTGVSGPAASRLVLRLLAPPGDALPAASTLTLSERDQLLAALHAECFGDRIESVVDCQACGERTDLAFSLQELVESAFAPSALDSEPSGSDAEGRWTLLSGLRFRLPTAEDEEHVQSLNPAEVGAALAALCIGEPATEEAAAELERALERVAPLVDTQLYVACSGCAAKIAVHFDIVTFFLSALARERTLLFREVHRLAAAYHWSLDEILRLSRGQRRAHVALIEGEQRPARRVG